MTRFFKLLTLSAVFCASAQVVAFAQEASQAKVSDLSGEARYLKKGASDWLDVSEGLLLSEGDKVKTGSASQVTLQLQGANKTAELIVRPESEFTFQTFHHDPATNVDMTLLDVEIGNILVKAEKLVGESKFEVKTPTSIVGIRGTVFEVQVSKT